MAGRPGALRPRSLTPSLIAGPANARRSTITATRLSVPLATACRFLGESNRRCEGHLVLTRAFSPLLASPDACRLRGGRQGHPARREDKPMLKLAAIAGAIIVFAASGAWAQKSGGVLRITHRDSPASMSIHEEGTISVVLPMMGVFNNLVVFDPRARQHALEGIVTDLAKSWTWSEDGKRLTFALREGVTWHDGKPFTAADVKCTWDLLADKGEETFKVNFRKGWYSNVEAVTKNGDFEVVFSLKMPQPAILALLASGFTPVYPCHVSPRDMRRAPIGTGPFKFVEYKSNQGIKVSRNPNYWKPGRPYLDGIEYTIIPNRSTAILAFVAGNFDMIFPYELTVPLVGDVKSQVPSAICDISPMNVAANILMNPVPPFDNLDVRRAVAMALDRKSFIDILTQGRGDVGG